MLAKVKLIAEPWDTGPNGYQLGNFPPGWAEWNDRYRDTLRSYWRGDEGALRQASTGILGSAETFAHDGRRPWASVNFVTAHDGFTLRDLVSYNDKHNEANQEGGADGHSHNLSWNCGVEGPTDDPGVIALRDRQRRNLMATLLLSQGTPMILMGDERGRSQAATQSQLQLGEDELAGLNRQKTGFRGFPARTDLHAPAPLFRRRSLHASFPDRAATARPLQPMAGMTGRLGTATRATGLLPLESGTLICWENASTRPEFDCPSPGHMAG